MPEDIFDAEIAVRVMGIGRFYVWFLPNEKNNISGERKHFSSQKEAEFFKIQCEEKGFYTLGVREHSPAHYSTDISAAWEVVEKLEGRFIWDFNSHKNWRVRLATYDRKDWRLVEGEAATAPLAICLAALKAVK